MANQNLISTTELIQRASEVLKNHMLILDQTSKSYQNLVNSARLPSTYVSNLRSQKDILEQVNTSTDKLEKSQVKLTKAHTAETKAIKSKIPTLRQLNTINKQNLKAQQDAVNVYNKVQNKIKQMIPVYNNLATKQQLGIKLTAKEEAQLELLTKRLNKYRGALNEVNKNYGNYSLEVGNYAKGTKNLQNAIGQVSRELPNFGQSFEVGVLSLTNNIGALIDGVKQVREENVKLKAQGQNTRSVFKTILGSIFSFQTLLFVGIGIFTAYSKEIKQFFKELFTGKETVEKTSVELEKLGKETAKSIGRLKGLVGVVQDVASSEEERLDAIIKLNNEYPEFNTNILQEKDNTKLLNEEIDKYIDLLIKRGKAKVLEEEIGKKVIESIKLEEKLIKQREKLDANTDIERLNRIARLQIEYRKLDNADNKRLAMVKEIDDFISYASSTERKYVEIQTKNLRNREEMNKLTEKLVDNYEAERKILEGTVEYYEELISANNKLIREKKTVNDLDEVRRLQSENKEYQKQIDLILNNVKANKKRVKKLKALKAETKEVHSLRSALEKQLEVLEKTNKLYFKFSEEGMFLTEQIERIKKAIEDLEDPFKDNIKDVEEWSETYERGIKLMKKLQAETESFLSGFSDSFIKSTPLASLEIFFDGTFKLLQTGADTTEEKFAVAFNAISESAQQAFNFINQLGQQNFDLQYERLEQQKELALQFAGENAEGRAEIERQYEERRRRVQRREAKAQQDLAVFNIGVDTAQAIVATLAKTPPPAGLPFAALMASIGLAQAIAVKSQQIPAFWMGGETSRSGNILVNDDPFGIKGNNYREVIEKPGGRIEMPKGRNVKMNVPKGTKIHPTYSSFLESLDRNLALNGISPFPESAKQNGLSPVIINQENGISEQTYKKGVQTIVSTIKNSTGLHISMDENGFRKNLLKGSAQTKLLNNKIHKKARRF